MARSRGDRPKKARHGRRVRVGAVSVYWHHGSWWLYFRQHKKPKRQRVGSDLAQAKALAAQVNAQLATGAPTMFNFTPVDISELKRRWLDHHEHTLRSSTGTISRYRTAVAHLARYVSEHQPDARAHEVDAHAFVRYLRAVQVAPNGHANTTRRPLRSKGVKFVLGACRALFNFAARQRLVPPYFENPFASLPIERMPVEDAKPIFVFDADSELTFLRACDAWAFPVFYALARIGLRVGELTHLLIEDVDLANGLLCVRNKPALGWQIKTRSQRTIPLPHEVMEVLRKAAGDRCCGVLFTRRTATDSCLPLLDADPTQLAAELRHREQRREREIGRPITRHERQRLARRLWLDAGAVKNDTIRHEFMRATRRIGLPHVTAPKCWRHSCATLLQEAGVDPLIRQQTLGHVPSDLSRSALGMTGVYTHTPREVHRNQLQKAVALRPRTSQLVEAYIAEGDA